MYGNAEKSPMNWIAWSFGLILIALILIVSFYMFVMYLKSQHKKNQFHDEERRLEEERIYRERMAAINNQTTTTGLSNTGSTRENNSKSEKSSENTERPEMSSRVDEYSVKNKDETKSEKPNVQKDVPKVGSKELSTEELSSKKSLTDLKPVIPVEKSTKTAIGEVSVEIPTKPQTTPKVDQRILSTEKAPGSSIGSDVSTYVISSQRSEMNNYNMLEAGRTPPTFSYSENPLHQTSSIESVIPNTAVATTIVGTPPTVIPAKQNSETMVSMTTPPNKK